MYVDGFLTEADLRRQKAEVDAGVAELREDDKVVMFDATRRVVSGMGGAIEDAGQSPERASVWQDLIRQIVPRVECRDERVVKVVPTPAAVPFFTERWQPEPRTHPAS